MPALRVWVPVLTSLDVLVVFARARIFTLPSLEVREIAPASVVRLLLRMLRSDLERMVMLFAAVSSLCFWVAVLALAAFSTTLELELAETLPLL